MKREIAIGKFCALFVLCGLFLLSLTPVLGRPASVAQARPNIVFILADDLRTGALSCEGHPLTSEQFALSIDIAPTLLELAGAPVPKDIQGRSLVPLLKGISRGWRKSILTEFYEEKGTKLPRIPGWQSVRTEQWKYIRYHEREGFDELYNLKADPFEMKNLITEPSAQAALKELKAELEKLLTSYQNAALVLQGDSVN